jgi:transposase
VTCDNTVHSEGNESTNVLIDDVTLIPGDDSMSRPKTSKCEKARKLYAKGIAIKDIAKKLGITYQSVYASTKGLEKATSRKKKYQAVKLLKSGKYSQSKIAKRTGVSRRQISNLLKKFPITNNQ